MTGPLAGIRVLEFAGQGPGPFGCMLLADLGADVVRVDRAGADTTAIGAHGRGRRSIVVDLKSPDGVEVALDLVRSVDVLVEGFRPGVMERLGLGPEACAAENPGLVYTRMTGWGQCGPLAQVAGHDVNYLARAGALGMLGDPAAPPTVPLNLVGDYGAGGPFLAFGVLAALWERNTSGLGQVVDVAMVDGIAAMLGPFHAALDQGRQTGRGANLLDGSAPCYGTYLAADGRYLAVGALEKPFYRNLLEVLGLNETDLGGQLDRSCWPAARKLIADSFATRTQAEWVAAFDGIDACVSPVLELAESRTDQHAIIREAFVPTGTGVQPAPAPRFSRTPARPATRLVDVGENTLDVLAGLGYSEARRGALCKSGAVA